MGVQGLFPLLLSKLPNAANSSHVSLYGRTVAIDASVCFYQIAHARNSGGQHIWGVWQKAIGLLHRGLPFGNRDRLCTTSLPPASSCPVCMVEVDAEQMGQSRVVFVHGWAAGMQLVSADIALWAAVLPQFTASLQGGPGSGTLAVKYRTIRGSGQWVSFSTLPHGTTLFPGPRLIGGVPVGETIGKEVLP